VSHACNPSYSGGRDQEHHGLKPAWVNSLQDPISKILNLKRSGGGAQVPSKCEALSSNSSAIKKTFKNK
jgi:hypothetical protein